MNVLEILQLCFGVLSLGFVIASSATWVAVGIYAAQRYMDVPDVQTLIGGALWSQFIVPVSFLLSEIVDEKIEPYLRIYFISTGAVILVTAGITLLSVQCYVLTQRARRIQESSDSSELNMDIVDTLNFVTGALIVVAGICKIVQCTAFCLAM